MSLGSLVVRGFFLSQPSSNGARRRLREVKSGDQFFASPGRYVPVDFLHKHNAHEKGFYPEIHCTTLQ